MADHSAIGSKTTADNSESFPYFEFSGSSEQIGKQSSVIADRIRQTYQLYYNLFIKIGTSNKRVSQKQIESKIVELSDYFATTVKYYLPELDLEISSIAQSCNLTRLQLYMLNARTEIFQQLRSIRSNNNEGECTTIYSAEHQLLAQNWDWMPELEKLCCIIKISTENKPEILTFTEPGIAAKIGINSSGLAVCLNILFDDCQISGIPVHILLRSVLECQNVSEAIALIEKLPLGTTSNLMLADSSGNAINLEIKGNQLIKQSPDDSGLIHTNHYLNYEDSENSTVPGSIDRHQRAHVLFENKDSRSLQGIKKILSDKDGKFPICRSYIDSTYFKVGTVAATIANLHEKSLLVCKGQPDLSSNWVRYSFNS